MVQGKLCWLISYISLNVACIVNKYFCIKLLHYSTVKPLYCDLHSELAKKSHIRQRVTIRRVQIQLMFCGHYLFNKLFRSTMYPTQRLMFKIYKIYKIHVALKRTSVYHKFCFGTQEVLLWEKSLIFVITSLPTLRTKHNVVLLMKL